MKKTYQLFVSFMLCMMGAMNVSAAEASLETIPFWDHESGTPWDMNAPKETQLTPYYDDASAGDGAFAFVLGTSTGMPYGDSRVMGFADLTNYIALKVTVTDGTPRFLFNRDIDDGQWNENEAESHLIDNTKNGWSAKYFSSETTDEGTVWTVDLKQLVTDKGYAHLHAIKGANWANVTVTSMVVVKPNKAVGWTNIILNSDMEGDDVSCFFTKVNQGTPQPSVITDGIGKDGSRGIMVEATAKVAQTYDNQFWFRFPEVVPAGTNYKVSFDYRADTDAKASTQAQAEPSDYIHYEMLGDVNFTTDWQTFSKEGTVTAQQAGPNEKGGLFQSIAFNLNELADANNYYFDNIKFEVYKFGTDVRFSNDVIFVDFGFNTNIGEMVKQAGAKRIFLNDCAKVTVNGQEAALYSVEGLEDGRFYIFLEEAAGAGDEVFVTFTNNFGLTYTEGANAGAAVGSFAMLADYDGEIEDDTKYPEPYPYDYVTPTVMKANPEDGSFNLPSSTSFTITFDKEADCSKLTATANGSSLSVNPASGYAKEVMLSGSLSNGVNTIVIDKIYPKEMLSDEIFGTYTFTVNIGEVEIDPNDQPEVLIPADNFNNCAAGSIPEGFQVKFGEEIRMAGESYSGGSRMFTFSEGGDFTRGLYYREGYVETAPALTMTANKNYVITFNLSNWKGSNSSAFQVLNVDEDVVFEQVVAAKGAADGNQNIVLQGTTKAEISFIPETSGNYTLRWVSDGFVELLLANVKVEYQPNVPGLKETLSLRDALDAARTTLEQNSDERYQGAAFQNLQAVISQYDGWKSTAPSEYAAAVEALNNAAQAMKDHRALCDDYDTQVKKAIDVVRQNEMPNGDPNQATKFVTTDLFAQLKSVVAKYNGTSEWQNLGDEENANWQLFYSFDVLTDDNQLTTAVAELKDIANLASLLFTEGVSAPENANGGKGTGVAVLVERLRLGAEALTALGAPENDSALQAFKTALTDDDALADKMKRHITSLVYNKLADPKSDLFKGIVDENTLEEVKPAYDMTVFVKNPNTYKQLPNANFTQENIPGWTTPEGYSQPGLTHGWGAYYNIEGVAEDCMFQTWGSSYRVEQTVNDLPAGVYTVKFAFGERNNGDAGVFEDSYAYVLTAGGMEYQSASRGTNDNGDEMFIPGIGQAFPFANNDNQVAAVEGITVTNGELTIGVNAGPSSHTFFNEVRILMTAPAAGFDYATAAAQGIETLDNEAVRTRAIELFDLNGRRIMNSRQGVVVMKRHLSDGTVKTEKIVRK